MIRNDSPFTRLYANANNRPAPVAPARNQAGPSQLPLQESALADKRHIQIKARMALYKEVIETIGNLVDRKGPAFSANERQQLVELRDSFKRLLGMTFFLLEGRDAPIGDAKIVRARALLDYMKLNHYCRDNLRELIISRPGEIVPTIRNLNFLNILAADLDEILEKNIQSFSSAAAEVVGYLRDLSHWLKNDSEQGVREANVQKDILGMIGSAVEGYAQARVDKHRHSARR